MNELVGIAMSRLGMTSDEFYQTTPIEFHHALQDHEKTTLGSFRLVCETLRILGIQIHNNAFGRKESQMIRDPRKLIQFSWERPKIQTVEEMKSMVLGLAHLASVKVKQKGKTVEI